MKLRIVNETISSKTVKVLTESGEDISKYITKMTLHFLPGRPVTVDAELLFVTADILAELGVVTQKEVEDV